MTLLACALLLGAWACGSGSEPLENATLRLSTTSTARAAETSTTSTTLREAIQHGASVATETTATSEAPIGEPGERRNPIAVGQEARVGDWKVRVVGVRPNATQIVLGENMFNDPPEEGNQYVLVSLEATYVGRDSSTFWVDMLYKFVGSKGTTFDAGTAVAPDAVTDAGETHSGASIAGNVVFEVATDEIHGGTILIQEAFSFDQTRMFFAIE